MFLGEVDAVVQLQCVVSHVDCCVACVGFGRVGCGVRCFWVVLECLGCLVGD